MGLWLLVHHRHRDPQHPTHVTGAMTCYGNHQTNAVILPARSSVSLYCPTKRQDAADPDHANDHDADPKKRPYNFAKHQALGLKLLSLCDTRDRTNTRTRTKAQAHWEVGCRPRRLHYAIRHCSQMAASTNIYRPRRSESCCSCNLPGKPLEHSWAGLHMVSPSAEMTSQSSRNEALSCTCLSDSCHVSCFQSRLANYCCITCAAGVDRTRSYKTEDQA